MASSEKAKAAARRYYHRNKKALQATAKVAYDADPEKMRERGRAWSKNHPNAQSDRLRLRRQEAFRILGDVCSRCGFTDVRALQIDHKDGGGTSDRKIHGTVWVAYDVPKHPELYQLLCANCNWIKRVENGEMGSRL